MPNTTGRTFWDMIAEIDDWYKWIMFVVVILVICSYFHIPL